MTQRPQPSASKLLWLLMAGAAIAFATVGTVEPWPVAAKELGAIGSGPFVPVSYSSMSSDRRVYRSQTYLVISQIGKSWSTYRVTEENKVARLEEVRFGVLYVAAAVVVFIFGAVWSLRRPVADVARRTDA